MTGADRPAGALFRKEAERYIPSELTEGPWDPNGQFGGSAAALLTTLVERTPTLVPMTIARMTIDFLRPVPLSPLAARLQVTREGKRVQLVQGSLLSGRTEVATCTCVRMRIRELDDAHLETGEEANPLPTEPRSTDDDHFPPGRRRIGSRRAQEFLFEGQGGYFRDPLWVRLRVPVLEGEATLPMAGVAYVADLATMVGATNRSIVRGINVDMNINVVRYPRGDWFCLEGTGWTSRAGVGTALMEVRDTDGMVATVTMARLVDPIRARS